MIFDIELNSAAHYPVAEIVELSPVIEAAGFGAFWEGESNSTDPLILLSGIAVRSRTLKLGTAIYHIFGRSAVTLGIQAATLQDMSGGRLLLGLGVANKTIAAWHGGTFDRPLRRIREYTDIVRKTAAGERVEYEGEIYTTGKRFQLSWKPAHPTFPIYLAGLGPQMTRLAGRISDGVFINMATPETIRKIAERVRAGAVEAGRDPDKIEIITKVRVSLNPDRAIARSRLRQVLTFYNIADHYKDMLIASGFEPEVTAVQEAFRKSGFKAAGKHITDAYMDKLPVIPGTSIQEIKERLAPFIEAGATRLVIPYVPVTDPVIEDARRFIEAWGKNS
ncbi:MAG: LLM class flavin-dependent oxidoreductase [Acidobacteria bacterium]|nr:LLM class flavin-dependent oxidoreductase [Acidobacteriota bacterium]MCH8266100.1 LLM class flavin-dependent oxidoreductase [Acidobacteriota bacterium]MCZ6491619.1 LLM class flavin-dependent oxidoreductase [Acidobacteriota bacterium]MCZ6753473.1 LLM class flavin-dependent oxidoreductase [Acidobacteriota bacterium]